MAIGSRGRSGDVVTMWCICYFVLFCVKMQGLATADLAHGNWELSLHLVAERKFV
jgi:hypothetical protein